MVDKQLFIHKRNDEGNLLPIEVKIEEMKITVKIIPLTKGEIEALQTEMKGATLTTVEQDKKLILKHVADPKFDEADLKFMKPIEYGHLVTAIMVGSGIPKDKINEATKNLLEKENPL